MKLVPVITEKTTSAAAEGKYTFLTGMGVTKNQVKKLIEETFGVVVAKVWSQNKKALTKMNLKRKKVTTPGVKRVVVSLKTKDLPKGKSDKLGFWEEKKK